MKGAWTGGENEGSSRIDLGYYCGYMIGLINAGRLQEWFQQGRWPG